MTLIGVVVGLLAIGITTELVGKALNHLSPLGRVNLLNDVRWAGSIVCWSLAYMLAAVVTIVFGTWWEGIVAGVWFGVAGKDLLVELCQYHREILSIFIEAWRNRANPQLWL